jgi:hypothetical protein
MFPFSSDVDSVQRHSTEHHGGSPDALIHLQIFAKPCPQMSHSRHRWSTRFPEGFVVLIPSCRPFNVSFPPQSQSNRGSRSVVTPVSLCISSFSSGLESSTHSGASDSSCIISASVSNNYEPLTPFSGDIHPPRVSGERVPFPRAQREGMPSTPPHTPGPPRYTGGFFTVLNSGSPPVPRLRPASWGSPSQVDEAFESNRLTRSRSSVDFRGNPSGEEDLPFSRRTLPSLLVPYDPWHSGVRTTPNTSSASSRDHSSDCGDLSTTHSVPSTSFPANFSDRVYR